MSLIEELEKDWVAGRTRTAKAKISRFLSAEDHSIAASLEMVEFFLRVYDFKSASHLIDLRRLLSSDQSLGNKPRARGLIMGARILNALGASSFSFELIERAPAKMLKPHVANVAGIMLINRRFREAAAIYESLLKENPSPNFAHPAVYLAQAFSGMHEHERALDTISRYLDRIKNTHSDLLPGATAVKGGILLAARQSAEARKSLEEAHDAYKRLPFSGNRAYVQLWLGGCHALEGDHVAAQRLFQEAWELFYRKGSHPESWLQVYYWQGLSEFRKSGAFPKTWLRLASYPGSWPGSLSEFSYSRLVESHAAIPREAVVSPKGSSKKPILAQGSPKAPLPERLLHNLILAGEGGLPKWRVYELLWPQQVYAVSQMSKRLEQLVIRLKQQGVDVRSSEGQLYCHDPRYCARWSREPIDDSDEFLWKHPIFKRCEVERYFNVGKSKAAEMCHAWLLEGKAIQTGAGRSASYRSITMRRA